MPHRFSRRHFTQLASALPLAASAAATAPSAESQGAENAAQRAPRFPDNFIWGTATSAYQIEGAVADDGRGPSIWDRYAHTPGKIAGNATGDRAADHFHRYKDDVQLMKALGTTAYRFSIAWPRIFPDGTGAANPKGLDFYNRLIDELLANGIAPYATLYHWDLPQALQDRFGGWQSRETSKAFGDYAGHVAARITDRVSKIFTINECATFVDLGYGAAPIEMAPGLKLPQAQLNQVRHNVALGHGLAVQAIRATGRNGTQVGPAENLVICVPAIETPANIRASEIAMRELNAGYLTAILEGRYTDGFL
ncbi:MAG: beta-glucosidase, partial [Tardiphaga sp.]|nr:beta-glucosidase [Tardiphaga sp.]